MSENIELEAGDACVILRASGDIQLLLPKSLDEDEPPLNVAQAMAFAVVAQSPVMWGVVEMMADSAVAEVAHAEPEVAQ